MVKKLKFNTSGGTDVMLSNGTRLQAIKMLLFGCTQKERDAVPEILEDANKNSTGI